MRTRATEPIVPTLSVSARLKSSLVILLLATVVGTGCAHKEPATKKDDATKTPGTSDATKSENGKAPNGSQGASGDDLMDAVNNASKVTDQGVNTVLQSEQGKMAQQIAGSSGTASGSAPAPAAPLVESVTNRPELRTIPLCPGLTVVTAVAQQTGDYESIKTIESVDATQVRMKYSTEFLLDDMLEGESMKKLALHRTMLTKDLATATSYQQVFLEKSDETIPGTVSIGASAAMLKALKTKREVEMNISNAYGGLELTADRNKFPNYYSYMQGGKIKKVGTVRVPVLVNEQPVVLPAIQAQGVFVGDKAEFFFLDDERNPLTLAFRLGIGGITPLTPDEIKLCNMTKGPGRLPGGRRCDLVNGGDRDTLRVVKITYHCAVPSAPAESGDVAAQQLESSLANRTKVDIYSIYFSFNSDEIRDESEPTLKEISDILHRHPDWNLRIAGHTDGIGSDAQNLDLSQRRAAAVKGALVKRYGINASRLSTTGFGKSQPVDTNDTLEGRAHNRRVELSRM
jgi:outer membrane protein OmpA-like peptidoglycan-associated protein